LAPKSEQRKYYNQQYRRPLKYIDNIRSINNVVGLNINNGLTCFIERKLKRRLTLKAVFMRLKLKYFYSKKIFKLKWGDKVAVRKKTSFSTKEAKMYYTQLFIQIKKSN
jgi:hypothetical protein